MQIAPHAKNYEATACYTIIFIGWVVSCHNNLQNYLVHTLSEAELFHDHKPKKPSKL